MLGLFLQDKMLPIKKCPITIELEMVSDPTLPIVSGNLTTIAGTNKFADNNCSSKWQLENVQVKVDMCTLDNSLDNSYTEYEVGGKSLPIKYNTFISQFPTLSSKNSLINVSRAVKRLRSVFITLDKTTNATYPEGTNTNRDDFYRKQWNDFF